MPQLSFIPTAGDNPETNNPLRQTSLIAQILGQSKQLHAMDQQIQLETQHAQLVNEGLMQQNAAFNEMQPLQKAIAFAQAKDITARAETAETNNRWTDTFNQQQFESGQSNQETNLLRNEILRGTSQFTIDEAGSRATAMKLANRRAEDDLATEARLKEEIPALVDFTLTQHGITDQKARAFYKTFESTKYLDKILGEKEQNKLVEQQLQVRRQELGYHETNAARQAEALVLQTYKAASAHAPTAMALAAMHPDDVVLQTIAKYADQYQKFTPLQTAMNIITDPNTSHQDKINAVQTAMMLGGQKPPTKKSTDPQFGTPTEELDTDALDRAVSALKGASKKIIPATTNPTIQKTKADTAGISRDNPVKGVAPGDELNLPVGTWYQGLDGRLRQRKG